MQANHWAGAAALLSEGCCVDWPCSGERIVGRDAFAAIQAEYPSSGGSWSFEIHRLIVEGAEAVAEVTVSDSGRPAARLVAFSTVADGLIVRQVEYWPTAYEPLAGRAHLTQSTARIP